LSEWRRTVASLMYGGWRARGWSDPAFPATFTWFNSRRYWEEHILPIKEQIAAVQEEPIGPL